MPSGEGFLSRHQLMADSMSVMWMPAMGDEEKGAKDSPIPVDATVTLTIPLTCSLPWKPWEKEQCTSGAAIADQRPNSPAWKSCTAWKLSSVVFITIGPYC